MWTRTVLLTAVAAMAIANCAGAEPSLDHQLTKAMGRDWPGAAVLVETPDGRIETAAAGFADLETRAVMRADSGFHLCSINKTITAAAILALVDRRKLSLDQTILTILDEPIVRRIPHIEQVTIRQLLDHSSGIYATNNDPEYVDTLVGDRAFSRRVWSPIEMVELATRPYNTPSAKPGEGHHYADTNYILLGMIIEHVTGEGYRAHVSRTILEPLGMAATYFHSDAVSGVRATPAWVARGYLRVSKELTEAVKMNPGFKQVREGLLDTSSAAERVDSAGGIVTTLPDLAKFASALFRGKLLSPASQKYLLSVADEMRGEPAGKQKVRALQGAMTNFGLVLFKEGDGPGGFNTLMAYHPETGRIFLGFTNQFGAFDEVDVMMSEIMGPMVTRKMRDASQ